jgi:twinkle protein
MPELHKKHAEWLEARGVRAETAQRYGLFTMSAGDANWLAFPYQDAETGDRVNCKYRLTGQKRFRMEEGAALVLWNLRCLTEAEAFNPSEPVVICEGEMDALTALQAGWRRVLSVPNGAPAKAEEAGAIDPNNDSARYAPIWAARGLLDRVRQFIIATDGDEPGRILAAELVRRLGAERCRFVEYPEGCKDLNDVLIAYGEGAVNECLHAARHYPVAGLYKIDDFPEPPSFEPYRLRVPCMWEMWPVLPGTFTVVTGYAGRGKTTWMMACLADLMLQGVHICMGSFETAIKPVLVNELRQHLTGACLKNLTPGDKATADDIMRERLTIIAQQSVDDDDDLDLEYTLELAKTAVLRDGARVLVLDPWNEMDHKRRSDESETEYTGRAIRLLKRFARDYAVAVVVVAHPAKPSFDQLQLPPSLYSIAGSSHWANKADYGIVIHRKKQDSNITTVSTVKVRMGLPGKVDVQEIAWNWMRARYERPIQIDEEEVVDA